jgi:hypothetical protein
MLASMKHERFYEAETCRVPEVGAFGGWVAHPSSFAAWGSGLYEKAGVTFAFAEECFPGKS